jgi:hypothetical protein
VLVVLAHAFLSILAAEQSEPPDDTDLVPLTRNEIAHLLATAIQKPATPTGTQPTLSTWRRRHQHTAQRCHYRRRQATPL